MMQEQAKNEISQLKHVRGVLKAKLTRFKNFLNDSSNQTNFVQIEIRLKSIEEDKFQFEECQSRLEFLDPTEESERENIEIKYFELIAFAKELLLDKQTANTSQENHDQPSLANNIGKLPDLGLPHFYGNYETWLGFYDIYNSVIHLRTDLSEIQKFLYLKLCCKGDALKIIENLEITAANYAIALDLLKQRFENRRAIINHHINSLLFKLPDVSRESASALRNLIDSVTQHKSALEKLNLPVQHWDALLIPIILRKLDDRSKREWESKLDNNKLPTLKDLTDFLSKKSFTLEAIYNESKIPNKTNSSNLSRANNSPYKNQNKQQNVQCYATVSEKTVCPMCEGAHYIYQCSKFLDLSVIDKYNEVRKHKLCSNCLRSGHYKFQCQSGNCRKCNLKHSTLLHDDRNQFRFSKDATSGNAGGKAQATDNVKNSAAGYVESPTKNDVPVTSSCDFNGQSTALKNIVGNVYEVSYANINPNLVLLSTAKILIEDNTGNFQECIALLDSGSQSNLMTESLCRKLNLNRKNFSVPLAGVNQIITNIKHKTMANVRSRFNSFQTKLEFLILPIITEKLPLIQFSKNLIQIPQNLNLADENYNEPKQIDVLLGANIFYELLGSGKIILGKNMPTLRETLFGWILTGTLHLETTYNRKMVCNFIQQSENDMLNESLCKFWQTEELPETKILSKEAQYCEEYFVRTTTKNKEGRYVVKLPFIENSTLRLGNSKELCLKRFLNTEYRLERNENLKKQYCEFMIEYENLKHMTLKGTLDLDNSEETNSYFIPHHAVLRENSLTTQCRIVFDASFKTNNNMSLNDLLCLGPTVQDDLFSIILRFRLRPVVLNADIKMMYRQILVDPSDRSYQQILWRQNKDNPIQVYALNTITYGTKSAPFLATRCLLQVAIENEINYPRTSKIIKNSFYMDDLILSVNSINEAVEIYSEITQILSQVGFELRKWSSNEKSVLEFISENSKLKDDKLILPHENKELKMLGISWSPNLDIFKYSIDLKNNFSKITKRSILSILSQIYDPLGLIGPALIKAKILIQKLWQLQLGWDEPVPEEQKISWLKFASQLPVLSKLQIKRQVLQTNYSCLELHGFCDASTKAYGAAIYLCSTNEKGEKSASLLCAKSKVAPIKILTLPRLELLAAFLLARLTSMVKATLDVEFSKTVLYTDSTIVLSWLKVDPSLLKTFVGNRVAKIAELTNLENWTHVKSKDNAADIISRGIDPEELLYAKMWFCGPPFLLEIRTIVTSNEILSFTDLPELKKETLTLTVSKMSNLILFEKYSTLSRLQRVVGYIVRFKNRVLKKIKSESNTLTVHELSESLNILIKLAQNETFCQEINSLKISKCLDKNSKLLNLNPFLDTHGILRVGGRIDHAPNITYNQKHPIVLPYKHKLTYLIIQSEHIKHLHVGTQNLLSILRLNYWPINGKNMVKFVIRSCIKCFRVKPLPSKFLMGQLPTSRVTPNRVFSQCAVDYAGPILVKDGVRRKSQLVKTYICIFVCLAVRAVHIELVHDLSTDSFLNALKRFISRRGKPSDIYSDNGLNFVGANNHFIDLYNLLSDKKHNKEVYEFLSRDKINWHFIPAKSPHMGGLWEASVKATKYHLLRVLGNATLHYEEMYTILIQIEACLNSRPLTPLSNDPNDFVPLTPAHFLIGESLVCTPQADVQNEKINRLSRYQYLQNLLQQFWSRWSNEYMSQLQLRTKWKTDVNTPIQLGSLVIMIEDNMPPLKWPMARVVALHPGADQITRVVSVRVASGSVFKRSLTKICVLPIEQDNV